MARFLKKRDQSRGLSPSSLVFIGNQKMETVLIRLIDYNQDSFKESQTTLSPKLRETHRQEFRNQNLSLGPHEEETVGCFVRSDTNVEGLDNG